ncbi:Kinase non-catalytic C-lobe domain-containing protein 1 [Apodemus speciosus]|uniref:Kinase non-catalytic C-lobe domain-containing protein 1 n=1 Tax=Apodemus speciosus TaxID=105296 RepID=A0ABQ0F0W1_APOSI
MQAMDPASRGFYEEDGKDLDFYDFEPLPTLPEDEENVSLADILSLRDRGLSEQEAWAVCLECSLSMRSVAHAAIFQTLCITPDTLAFNTSGNVCFMEQLSDDPEGAFVPPEFDLTGNTFEAHIYSLGATLKAALEYVTEPELEPKLSPDLEGLLSQMQAEDPRDRPDLESIIALCEEKMQPVSSCRLCRSLSAIGRRVLSIESFGAFQELNENTWRGRPAPRNVGPKKMPGDLSTDPEALSLSKGLLQPPASRDAEQEAGQRPRAPSPKPLLSAPMRNGENPGQEGLANLVLDAKCPLGELDRDILRRSRLRKAQTFPRLLQESTEASTLCLSLNSSRNQLAISEFFPQDPRKLFLEGKNGLSGFKAQSKSRLWPEQEPGVQLDKTAGAGRNPHRSPGASGQLEASSPSQGPVECKPSPSPVDPEDSDREVQIPRSEEKIPEESRQLGSAATEQSLSLQDLLSKLGRPFRENTQLACAWTTCWWLRTGLCSSDHPLPMVHTRVTLGGGEPERIPQDGKNNQNVVAFLGAYNSLFLAPEVSEEKLVTEKASVYCVAAVLWTAAKFSVPRDHKLALPRRLKTLLLDMARRHASERPSAAEAIKVCSSYLLQRGMDSSKILAHLRASTCKVHPEEETIGLQNAFSVAELKPTMAPAPESNAGFLQVSNDTKLVAVPGPVPGLPPCCKEACELPAAFTSEATHFKPIVLAQDTGVSRDQLALSSESNEKPKQGSGQPDREGTRKQAVLELVEDTDLKLSDQLPPDPDLQGATPDPAGDSVPHSSDTECSCPRSPALVTQQKGLSGTPSSPASSLPPEHRPDGQGPRGTTVSPGPTSASQGSRHPYKPPRGKAAVNPSSPRGPDGHPEKPRPADRKLCPSSVETSSPPKMTACPSLQEAMRLIQEEFAFDGYMDNGLEALIMGEYIYALKDLTFATFCGAISEKFCDLYWDEQLLKNLFKVVNGPASPSESSKEKPASTWGSGGPCSPTALSDIDSDTLSQGNFEVGFRSQKSIKVTREQQPEAEADGQPGPSQESTSNASDTVARLARSEDGGPAVSSGAADFQNCSPGWSSAFYEADCFGADVYNYVKDLERQKANGHTELEAQNPYPDSAADPQNREATKSFAPGPSEMESRELSRSSQELEQQLMIEKRNYRKTLKFYQKLLQKEKRSKGSEVRTMLSKLRGQLDEMKSKVQFLGLVKKYLQVMYAERWGLEPLCSASDCEHRSSSL